MKSLLILLSLVSLATARIGETPAQCTARYGEALDIDKESKSMTFEKSGLSMVFWFHEGVAQRVIFAKVEKDTLGNPVELSAVESHALLNANGSKWTALESEYPLVMFQTLDGKTFAQASMIENYLLISRTEYNDHLASEKRAKEKAALEGF